MDIFDVTKDSIHELIKLLTGWDCPDLYCLIIARIIVWAVIITVIGVLIYKYIIKPTQDEAKYIRLHIDSGYVEYLSKRAQKYYIPTRFQSIAPNHYPDIMDSIRSASTENMIRKYIDEIFVTDNTNSPLYCVLGGSGMGKTSFLINVLKAYLKKHRYNGKPFDIELINLANDNYANKISAIKEPKNTILLLDALDENSKAVSEYDAFISSLEEAIELFRIVVVTCRTQFFPDEEHELQQSKIQSNGRAKGFYAYTRHYISPFSDAEVEKYLRRRYGLRFRKRKAARRIVEQCTSFTHRPLLLSYIDTLLSDKRNYETTLDVYETLIEKWIERDTSRVERPKETRELLLKLLQESAVRMYMNFPHAGYYLEKEEIDMLLAEAGQKSLDELFRGRSLLNRDAIGVWKFSHKSFLEFFLAKEYYENENFTLDFIGLDVALLLFQCYCRRELDKHLQTRKIKLLRSHEMAPEFDVLVVEPGSSFNLRYIEPFDKIRILEIDAKLLERIERCVSRTKVYYIRIMNYHSRYNINWLFKYPQIRYVTVMGQYCSKSFIKESKKHGVVVLNNGDLFNYNNKSEDKDVPLDIKAAFYADFKPFDMRNFWTKALVDYV